MKFIKIKSHAKINLTLNVTGKSHLKIHKVESLVCFIGLHDLIYLRPINSLSHRIFFFGKFSKGINKKNTISTLLKILDRKNLLNNKKFEIKIKKNIPQKSGMGGGSMNAASILNYFLKKKYLKLKKKQLIDITRFIGSDVILGMYKENVVLSSSGKVRSFKNKANYHLLIIKPNFGCSTKLIYSKVRSFSKSQYNKPKKTLFNTNNLKKSFNDLEKIAIKKYPKLKILRLFLSKSSNIIFTRMTGSGSSIVAYFYSKKAAHLAKKEFKKKFRDYWCITSKTI
jgi:4-diphosphocytidyl-2-C-methyl-D-erythritol kinase